jgi:ssDNA-binding Zn-finger/Zn-ribbon topoisomerase 1
MNGKNILTIVLLLFVMAAIVTTVIRQSGEEPLDQVASTQVAADQIVTESTPENGLVATYFHGEVRCPTCRNIEKYAQQAIEEKFAKELGAGDVQWRTMNYETPANQHFADDYGIVSSTVVLVRMVDSKPTQWRNLEKVWNHVGNQAAFTKYVQSEAKEMLAVQ